MIRKLETDTFTGNVPSYVGPVSRDDGAQGVIAMFDATPHTLWLAPPLGSSDGTNTLPNWVDANRSVIVELYGRPTSRVVTHAANAIHRLGIAKKRPEYGAVMVDGGTGPAFEAGWSVLQILRPADFRLEAIPRMVNFGPACLAATMLIEELQKRQIEA